MVNVVVEFFDHLTTVLHAGQDVRLAHWARGGYRNFDSTTTSTYMVTQTPMVTLAWAWLRVLAYYACTRLIF